MKKAGWRIMYTPISTVTHVKRAASSQRRVSTVHAFYDAMRIFYGRHYENEYPRWVSWLVYRGIDMRQTAELAAIKFRGSPTSSAS